MSFPRKFILSFSITADGGKVLTNLNGYAKLEPQNDKETDSWTICFKIRLLRKFFKNSYSYHTKNKNNQEH